MKQPGIDGEFYGANQEIIDFSPGIFNSGISIDPLR